MVPIYLSSQNTNPAADPEEIHKRTYYYSLPLKSCISRWVAVVPITLPTRTKQNTKQLHKKNEKKFRQKKGYISSLTWAQEAQGNPGDKTPFLIAPGLYSGGEDTSGKSSSSRIPFHLTRSLVEKQAQLSQGVYD